MPDLINPVTGEVKALSEGIAAMTDATLVNAIEQARHEKVLIEVRLNELYSEASKRMKEKKLERLESATHFVELKQYCSRPMMRGRTR